MSYIQCAPEGESGLLNALTKRIEQLQQTNEEYEKNFEEYEVNYEVLSYPPTPQCDPRQQWKKATCDIIGTMLKTSHHPIWMF